MKLFALICFYTILSTCHGYRILGLFPYNGKSHFIMFEHLMKALARKGHQVDVVSTFPLKKPYPNYNDIVVLPSTWQSMNNVTFGDLKDVLMVSVTHTVAVFGGNNVCESLSNPKIQQLAKNPPKDPSYDVVLVEVRMLRF
ncbi:UDP-glucosyltransferase 2-like [Augochlora pura]